MTGESRKEGGRGLGVGFPPSAGPGCISLSQRKRFCAYTGVYTISQSIHKGQYLDVDSIGGCARGVGAVDGPRSAQHGA